MFELLIAGKSHNEIIQKIITILKSERLSSDQIDSILSVTKKIIAGTPVEKYVNKNELKHRLL